MNVGWLFAAVTTSERTDNKLLSKEEMNFEEVNNNRSRIAPRHVGYFIHNFKVDANGVLIQSSFMDENK